MGVALPLGTLGDAVVTGRRLQNLGKRFVSEHQFFFLFFYDPPALESKNTEPHLF